MQHGGASNYAIRSLSLTISIASSKQRLTPSFQEAIRAESREIKHILWYWRQFRESRAHRLWEDVTTWARMTDKGNTGLRTKEKELQDSIKMYQKQIASHANSVT
ncbi:predicted protein [Histoplasma capsulatum var. duboisii H88]|uniref:Predicted protein n=1 Tax=Ajellomyces capsulatus (strain H88) TaxID=544711 RepID=F0UR71_AJEC8|nr:predicted protein [Histoplasma capsulatum var. duboisii H88]